MNDNENNTHVKLKKLREEKEWGIEYVSKKTKISMSSIYRHETTKNQLIPYQDLLEYTKLYNVSLDYLCGITDTIKYRETPIDELHLTDGSIEFLKSNKNSELLNDLLSNEKFPQFLEVIEFFVSGEFQSEVSDMKALHTLALDILDNKGVIDVNTILGNQAEFDDSGYQRFLITESFNEILKDILIERKKNMETGSYARVGRVRSRINEIMKIHKIKVKPGFSVVCQILGVNLDGVAKENVEVFKDVITNSNLYKVMNNKKLVPTNSFQNKKIEYNVKQKTAKRNKK